MSVECGIEDMDAAINLDEEKFIGNEKMYQKLFTDYFTQNDITKIEDISH